MAFDWQRFAAKTLEGMSENFERSKAEAREFKEAEERAAERNYQIVQQRQQRASTAAQLGQRAMALGASEGQVRTAMSSGMTGVSELYEKLQTAANQRGVKRLGVDDIEAIVNMPNIPAVNQSLVDKDMTLREFADMTYGVGIKAAPMPEKEERGVIKDIIGGAFGLDAKEQAKRSLRNTPYVGKMSVADINAAARSAEYQSMFPEATITFTDVDFFTSEKAYDFSSKMTSTIKNSLSTDAAKAYIKSERMKGKTAEERSRLEAAARKEITEDAVKPLIEYMADTYQFGGFFQNTLAKNAIIAATDQGYYDELADVYAQEAPDAAEEIEDAATPNVEAALNLEPTQEEEKPAVVEDPKEEVEPVVPSVEPRPKGGRAGGTMQWDKKYKGKYNSDGTPIMVEPRPDKDTVALMDKSFIEKGYSGSGKKKVSAQAEWDKKYGKTHNPDGTPKAVEE